MTVGRRSVDEPSIRPRLTRSRRKPAITHRKLLGERTDNRHLLRGEIVHDISANWPIPLRQVIFDEPIHGRHRSRICDIRRSK